MKLRNVLEEMYAEHQYSWSFQFDYCENTDTFTVRYESGGTSGGDCWGGVSRPYIEPIPDFTLLQEAAVKAYPNIGLRAYLSLYGSMKIEDEERDEYYGNSTVYRAYHMSMPKMKKILTDEGYE